MSSIQHQGTKNTDPMLTLMARRLSGSHDVGVSITASIPSAAAERNIAPIFVVSTTESIMTILCDVLHRDDGEEGCGRRMAHSTPRVRVYPVN